MKILLATSECDPFAKVGGLGDVIPALATELKKLGHDIRIVLPKYGSINLTTNFKTVGGPLYVNMGYGLEFAKVLETQLNGVNIYFIEFNRYFARNGIYGEFGNGYDDNWERFAFFNRAVLDLCEHIQWSPDVIHCNDWPTGIIPALLTSNNVPSTVKNSSSVYTIHNMAHHGYAHKELIKFIGLPEHYYHPFATEALSAVNFMKCALQFSKKITTVSPRYSEEIKTKDQGYGLDDVLRYRAADLIGILNGIDTNIWNPQTDKFITKNFSVESMSGKQVCKLALQKELNLPIDEKIPIFGVISRLYEQKGLDYLCHIIGDIVNLMNVQFIILGSGEMWLEGEFSKLSQKYPNKIAVKIGYDNRLSHMIEAGSDFFVMPSRYEPCGLNQMYSMRYGTLPIAHYTGGLADTVENYDEKTGEGTGFVFYDMKREALYNTLGWACSTFYNKKNDIKKMQKRAMQKDFSWRKSAKLYVDVYKAAINCR